MDTMHIHLGNTNSGVDIFLNPEGLAVVSGA